MKHTLVALVEDKPGVLNRVSSLLRRRNFNIDSIAVGHTEQPNLSRMTIIVEGDDARVEQARKQLDKVIEVVKIVDITSNSSVARELALVKVKATASTRNEIIQIVDIFRANIVDVSSDSLIVEVTGDEDKVNSLLDLFRGFGIREIARTGRIALTRGGAGPLQVEESREVKASKQQLKAPPLEAESPPNLRDSGCQVIVAEAKGTDGWKNAKKAGFKVTDAAVVAKEADIIVMLVPDTLQSKVYRESIEKELSSGKMLMFAHGFNIHFGQILPPDDVDVTMIAPKCSGHKLRRRYNEGSGAPALVAVHQDARSEEP